MMMFMDEEAARDLLRVALRKRRRADQAAETSRLELYAAVRDASVVLKQADIVRETGWSREHVRQIIHTQIVERP